MTIDGKHREMNGRTLAAAALCALRPDRVLAFVRTHVEPQCLKVNLEETLGCAAAATPRRCAASARLHACTPARLQARTHAPKHARTHARHPMMRVSAHA